MSTQAATAPPAAGPTGRGAGRVTQARVVRSEWIKLRTLRSTWYTYAATVGALVGLSLLVSAVTASHWDRATPAERLTFDPVARSLAGVHLAQLAIGVLGVLVVTGEYATGMIRSSFVAVPRRLPVLWAKLAVFVTVTLALAVPSAFVAFLAGQRLLGAHGTTLAAPHALRAVVGVALYLAVVGVLGIGLGFALRSTAGGIAALFGLLLVLPIIGRFLPADWQNHVVPYLPGEAGSALFVHQAGQGTLAPWTGFAVMCAWAVAALLAAVAVILRRDA